MLFNPCRNKDFLPDFKIENSQIEMVEQSKLLGVVIASNLSWSENTAFITKKCFKRMWLLKRLANLGASRGDLLDVYNKQIRCITEYSAPVWNSALTKEDIANIERVQRSALHIITGDQYLTYDHALKSCGLSRL